MSALNEDEIRQAVRREYGRVAESGGTGCGTSCCGAAPADSASMSRRIGYSDDEIGAVPEGADMGLGCGNPQAIAALRPGDVVLDLGSGGGFDCFLAAHQVGEGGRVIGVDMTPEMISKSRANAERGGYRSVEFRLGEIESLPLADESVDVIISNCVINLSPDKARVFREAWRVLKPGGRLAISDIVATGELPEHVRADMDLYTGCIAGASQVADLEAMLAHTGFTDIRIVPKGESADVIRDWTPDGTGAGQVLSASIEAVKPASRS